MSLSRSLLALSALVAAAHAQGVIVQAQGTKGTPASLPLQIQLDQNDANIINQTEISDNVTNECGRTLLAGNIDIGANTENQLANKTVTSVTKGSKVTVAISQGDANGAGPYTCDMDQTSNSNGISGQTALDVAESNASNGVITLTVTMPSDMACTGASTGNICTVRCFNTAAAGPFGGCFAVQQTDVDAKENTPENIETAQTLEGIQDQVLQDQQDLGKTLDAIGTSGSTEAEQGVALIDNLLDVDSTAQATVAVASASAAAATTAASTGKKSGKKTGSTTTTKGKGTNNANANANTATNRNGNNNAATANNRNGNNRNNKRQMKWGKRYVIPAAALEDVNN